MTPSVGVVSYALRKKIDDFNEGKIPTRQVMKKVQFHQEERRECNKRPRLKLNADDRSNGSWKITADIHSVLVFAIIVANKQPDLVIWNEKDKRAMLLDLTVPRERNFEQAEEQKVEKYEDLIEECDEQEWEVELVVVVSDRVSLFI